MLARIFRALPAAALALAATAACAQDYPTRNIVLVVPFAAGGPTDTLGRNLAVSMTNTLKQQVIVENVAGAGGTIGYAKVAKSKPDGYTVLLAHIGMSTAPAMYRQFPVNPLADYEYIGQVADVPMTLIAAKKVPPNNLKDFITYAKANKDKITYGNAGLGAASHLCGLLFLSAIEADVQTVSYKGTAPAMTDLIGGHIDFMCDQTTNTTSQIKAGTVKVYGVTSRARVPSLKDVPTMSEAGLKGFEVVVWHGLYVSKNTPKPVLDKLVGALQTAVKDPTFKGRLEELGAEPVSADKATPASLQTHLKAEIAKWGPIIKKAGAYAD
jgi:tripartite-type tricarboxylate transporter receptor subunit TctC